MEIYSAIHYLQKSFVFEFLFPSRIVSAHLYLAMRSLQMERIIKKKLQKYIEELIVGINGFKLLILRQNNFLNINPTLKNSKYAFLYPFSILFHRALRLDLIFFTKRFKACEASRVSYASRDWIPYAGTTVLQRLFKYFGVLSVN